MLAPSVGKYCIWRGPIVLESVFLLECVCVYETHFKLRNLCEQNVLRKKDRASLLYSKKMINHNIHGTNSTGVSLHPLSAQM